MQRGTHVDEEIIELSCKIQQLEITIKGPASQASKFLASVTSGSLAGRVPSPGPSEFEVVSSAAPSEAPARVEHRSEIAASFSPCPGRLLDLGSRLYTCTVGNSSTSPEERIKRAWTAGQWAKAVVAGRIHSPNRTPPLELRSRFYAVAKCDRLSLPTIFKSSGSYWQAVGSLQNSTSVSQSFPSELEAKIYFESAGIEHYETRP